jgi:hypothetical protein
VKLAPDFVYALDSRARVYEALGRAEDAILDFERIIELGTSPELAQQAQDELEGLRLANPPSTEIEVVKAGLNVAAYKHVTISREIAGYSAGNALDSNLKNWWSAGAFAPQWIQIDLKANYVVAEFWLLPSQSPAGKTTHRVLVKGPATNNEFILAYTFDEATRDSKWLVYHLPEALRGIRYVRIESVSSPSWIGWREIKVIAGE